MDVGQAIAGRFVDREEPEHVEQQIYSDFYNLADKHVLEEFRYSNWKRRTDLVRQLEDQRLKQLGARLIFWYAPEFASASYQVSAQSAIRERWLSNEASAAWTTKADVELQLDEIEADEVVEKIVSANFGSFTS
jgi:exodeoxyribonuclease I